MKLSFAAVLSLCAAAFAVDWQLYNGWNLVSSPSDTQKIQISSLPPTVLVVWAYDAQAGAYTKPDYIEPSVGYWLKSGSNVSLALYSLTTATTRSLTPTELAAASVKNGWNLLGSSSSIDTSALKNLGATAIWAYDAQAGSYGSPATLTAGMGFWAKFADAQNTANLFEPISSQLWNEDAVRQVLKTFAFGGFATDAQITEWAAMSPADAVSQMLTFEPSNVRLSPPESDGISFKTSLKTLANFFASPAVENRTVTADRVLFDGKWDSPYYTWTAAVNKRGLNPFRERVAMWETNYHMAINQDSGVYPGQMFRYYDDIASSLSSGISYDQVLSTAALSSGVAVQYGHLRNIFENGKFRGNEDFAREFHQLFFGILGSYDANSSDGSYHEFVTIRNTAKALTDMSVAWITDANKNSYHDDKVTFGTLKHYPAPLEMLYTNIEGQTAKEKISALAKVDIRHKESLSNLPVMIVQGLADTNLNESAKETIRSAWAAMGEKNLLTFLRSYAASSLFHSQNRFRYLSSIERNFNMLNAMTLNNQESYLGVHLPRYILDTEGVKVFHPTHDVFGSQTGSEASDNPEIFKTVYNRSTKTSYYFDTVEKKDSTGNIIWQKNWAGVMPKNAYGYYDAKTAALWLWKRFVGSDESFGTLEKAHLYAILGSGQDLALALDENDPLRVYTIDDLTTNRLIADRVADLGVGKLALDSNDSKARVDANRRVGRAVAFIAATPYVFAEGGK